MQKNFFSKIIFRYIPFLKAALVYRRLKNQYCIPTLGFRDESSVIGYPIHISYPKNVFLYENTRINSGAVILTYQGRFVVKKFTAIACGFTAITGNHTPTVGYSQFQLGRMHINDREKDIIIDEDVWIGANVTVLSGVHIGRGCVIGACSLVNKEIPPYAVVVGSPARIIASKFTLEQILLHEEKLYSVEERFSKQYLEDLFRVYYVGKSAIGVE